MFSPQPSPQETIVALASGPGHSTRAVVRLSGPATMRTLQALAPHLRVEAAAPTTATARFTLSAGVSVPAQVLLYHAPRSFTGEDAAELLLSGDPWLTSRLVEALCAAGNGTVRPAQPGEFAARAYLAGKLSLAQAEAIAAIIAAGDASELAAARRVLAVGSGAEATAAADEIATLLALVEAGIDFADTDDVVAISGTDLRRRAAAVVAALRLLAGHARARTVGTALPVIALCGLPNAGKSTLLNALLGRQRAVVSPVAGTTRDALTEPLAAAPSREPFAMLTDLPGISEAPATSGSDMLAEQSSRRVLDEAEVLVWCDPHGLFAGPGPLGAARCQPGSANTKLIRVRTKSDLPHAAAASAAPASQADLEVCAVDGRNIAHLRELLQRAAWAVETEAVGHAALLPQHRQAAAKAASLLERLCALVERESAALRSPELVAAQLREALAAMAPLTGRVHPDDIVGRIFGMFCIGK